MACKFLVKFPKDFLEEKISVFRRHNRYVTTYRVSGFPHIDMICNKVDSLIANRPYLLKLTSFATVPDSPDSNIPKLRNIIFHVSEAPAADNTIIPASLFYHSEILPTLLENDRSLFFYGLSNYTPVFFVTNVIMNAKTTQYHTKTSYLLFYLALLCDHKAINLYYENNKNFNPQYLKDIKEKYVHTTDSQN